MDRAATERMQVFLAGCPIALIGILLGVYFFSSDLYLRYVLEGSSREGQAVELLTFGAALLAGGVLGCVATRLWLDRRSRGTGPGSVLVAGVALVCLFFAGEEVSWGQSLAGEKLFESSLLDADRDTNIHNGTDIPVQSIGSVFLVVFFVALPIA